MELYYLRIGRTVYCVSLFFHLSSIEVNLIAAVNLIFSQSLLCLCIYLSLLFYPLWKKKGKLKNWRYCFLLAQKSAAFGAISPLTISYGRVVDLVSP